MDILKYQCPNKTPKCDITYDFERNAIFVWSKNICVADEVFHSFFACRGKREIYFSSFVSEMTLAYKDPYEKSAKFLSLQIFISCMMSWIINQGIDYRSKDAICPFCGHNPEALACDGVLVGVDLKYMQKLKNIAVPEKNERKDCLHRRNTRILYSGMTPRKTHLRQYLLAYLQQLSNLSKENPRIDLEEKKFGGYTHSEKTQNELMSDFDDIRCKQVFKALFDQTYPLELAKAIAKLVIAVNGRAALFNFFPTKDRLWLFQAFETLKDPLLSEKVRYDTLSDIQKFRPQFSAVMYIAIRFEKAVEIAGFFQFMIETTTKIHENDNNYMPDEPTVVEPYDPTTGISYNFTEHGGQIRKLPKYFMDSGTEDDIYKIQCI